MAFISAERVKETSITTGTSDFVMAGAATGCVTFASAMATGDLCDYCAELGAEWEIGIGTWSDATNTLTRTYVSRSSNSDAKVSFSAGSKEVFITIPAEGEAKWDAVAGKAYRIAISNGTIIKQEILTA